MLKYIRPLAILVTLLGSTASSVYAESFLAAQSDGFCIHFDRVRNALYLQGTIKLNKNAPINTHIYGPLTNILIVITLISDFPYQKIINAQMKK